MGMLFFIFSCNAQVDLDINKQDLGTSTLTQNPVQADVKATITFKKYLISYMNDLLGTKNMDEIIDMIGLEEFLKQKSGISNIQVKGMDDKKNISEIRVAFLTENILLTLNELDIPYEIKKKNGTELEVQMSREFLTVFLNNFGAIRDLNVVDIFFPDKETVPEEEFPEYIAWSFSDYQPTETVINDIHASTINFSLIKSANIGSTIPDEGWQLSESNNTQEKTFNFVSVLYSDKEQLQIKF